MCIICPQWHIMDNRLDGCVGGARTYAGVGSTCVGLSYILLFLSVSISLSLSLSLYLSLYLYLSLSLSISSHQHEAPLRSAFVNGTPAAARRNSHIHYSSEFLLLVPLCWSAPPDGDRGPPASVYPRPPRPSALASSPPVCTSLTLSLTRDIQHTSSSSESASQSALVVVGGG
eukprot:GHVU01049904.1.p1 GENE.GHVU01049904.1~~GHVU01049904.1.p1  ORF type:complete len:173 (-),score=1.49 GHVU01049904.1:12-530(-)